MLFAGGDGRLYAFDPLSGERRWMFDGNKAARLSERAARERHVFVASPVVEGGRAFVAMGRDPEAGVASGALWAVDLEQPGQAAAAAWMLGGKQFARAIADVTVYRGTVYAADLNGFVVAVDAESGEERWRYDAFAPIWAAPTVLDSGLFIVDTDGDVAVFDVSQDPARPELESEIHMGSPIFRAPVAAGGILFLMSADRLYALSR